MQCSAFIGFALNRLPMIALIAPLAVSISAQADEPKVDHASACKVGRAESCLDSGAQLYNGKGVRANKAKAAKAFERGCDLGNVDCCSSYTLMLVRGDGVRRDPIKAMKTADRGCNLGSALLCAHVGKVWLEGAHGLPKDVKRALGYLDQACRAGEVSACGALCIGRATQEFGPPDTKAALDACTRGCELSDGSLCLRAGSMMRIDFNKPAESVDLYEKACSYQILEGCRVAAGLLLGGGSVKLDVLRARSILGVCCANKNEGCCTQLARLEALRAEQAGTDSAPRPPLDRTAPPAKLPPDLPPASRSPPPPPKKR